MDTARRQTVDQQTTHGGIVKTCQFGAYGACDVEATTKRQRPSGESLWDVCERHAAFLDRLRANVKKHAELLAKLRDA